MPVSSSGAIDACAVEPGAPAPMAKALIAKAASVELIFSPLLLPLPLFQPIFRAMAAPPNGGNKCGNAVAHAR